RFVAPLADRILVTTEAARTHLPARKVVVTGYPVRGEVRAADRAAARQELGLSPDSPVLLVFGGSQGARHINQAVLGAAAEILPIAEVLHVAGQRDEEVNQAAHDALPDDLRSRHHLFGYLDSAAMAAALAAADLAVCRAGASTLGELPARGL